MGSLVERLADFALQINYGQLPTDVVHESKRILLDSIGCALAGLSIDKGKIAVQVARDMGGPPEAKIIGTGDKVSAFAAAFANGELINALDYDVCTIPPGHVTPFVIPTSLAIAEEKGCSGKNLIFAMAIAHEVSARFGPAMAYYRDVKPGEKISFPPVSGFSSSIFGGTLAAGMLLGLDRMKLASALGLAGHIAPAHAMTRWTRTLPASSDKYLMAGWISQAEVLAVLLAERGYKGDIEVLEGEYGFWRYMGSTKWNPDALIDGLGEKWQMLKTTIYKLYPCCRIQHTVLDCLAYLIEENQLAPEEIEKVNVYCDPHGAALPMWSNKNITSPLDAQMSVPFTISLVAHRVKSGPEWQDLDTLKDERIIAFMDRVNVEPHPEFEKALQKDSASRIGKVELIAKGKKFSEERMYRKGSPATEETKMTDAEVIAKFRHNAARVLPSEMIERIPDMIFHLDDIDNVSRLAQMW